jgi:hypothetical protein
MIDRLLSLIDKPISQYTLVDLGLLALAFFALCFLCLLIQVAVSKN